MFEWSQQHNMMREMIRRWLVDNLEPVTEEMEEGKVSFVDLSRKLYKDMAMGEMIKITVEKAIAKKRAGKKVVKEQADDDMEMDATRDAAVAAIVSWEMSRVNPGFCLSFGAALGLCGNTILSKGTPEQIEEWGMPVMMFEKVGAWGVTETGAGSDAFATKTIARKDGDHYIINGSKIFITNAPVADTLVIYARLDDGSSSKSDKRNVHPFVMDRNTPGLECSKPMKKMGMKSSPTGEVFLTDVRVHKDQLLGGEPGGGREQVKDIFAGERTGSAPMSAGIVERCLEVCVKYTTQREQFGKAICHYQLMQKKIADMYIEYNNIKNIVFQQIWQAKQGKANWKDACAAKLYCTDAAVRQGMEAVQILGGYGYTNDFPCERLVRDAKLLTIGGGTSEIQTLNLAKAIYAQENVTISLSGS